MKRAFLGTAMKLTGIGVAVTQVFVVSQPEPEVLMASCLLIGVGAMATEAEPPAPEQVPTQDLRAFYRVRDY